MASITAQALITGAFVDLGIQGQGGTPSIDDSNEALTLLNYMIQQWHIQNKFVWQIVSTLWPLVANTGSYTIGPTGTFNGPRPTFIEQAYISFLGPGANQMTSRLNLLTAQDFNDISDLSATAELPQGLYNDRAAPLSTLYLYPKPRVTVATSLQLLTWSQIGTFTNLATAVDLPDGYAEAIRKALAVRCMPMFGVAINPAVAQLISATALQAEAAIADLNMMARRIMGAPTEGTQQ